MSDQYELVAVKRKWCPEWLYAVMSWPVDMVSPKWLPFRWMLTTPVKPKPSFKELLDSARNSLGYHIEGCFLCETPEQEEDAANKLRKFIEDNYTPKSPND